MPKVIYKTQDGKRVPSVTTVIKNLNQGEGLIHWAHRVGLDGMDLDEARQKQADIGTLAHILIESECKEKPLTFDANAFDPAIVKGAMQALEMWREWKSQARFQVLSAETSIVSEAHRFGGTFDVCAMSGRRRVMVDWKTSKDIYAEHWIQIAAYGALWNEAHPDQPIESYAILRLGKLAPSFDYAERAPDHPVIVRGLETFLTLRKLHDLVYDLKKGMS